MNSTEALTASTACTVPSAVRWNSANFPPATSPRTTISVASNEIPVEMTALVRAAMAGDFVTARHLHHTWFALMEINFAESSPIPVKAALAMMALIEPVWRLPLTPPSDSTRHRIEAVLRAGGLLPSIRKRHAA